ncbi:MAG TPA: lysophospholipid acyltransferase family protein [Tepidisphaeraceae bacterium]|nr:lysophospholipid acyltransferase family protein [Tepidisphaeraceae bacterium]
MTTGTQGETKPPPGSAAPADAAPPDRRDPVDRPSPVWKTVRLLVRVWATLAFDLKVYGVRNVPTSGGVLIVSNHQGNLDPPLLGVRLPRPMSYMAKSELFRRRWFAWLIRSLGAFPVKQGTGDVGAIKETVSRLQEGRVLNIFPEGSRTETGEIGPMLPGAALVVRRAGVPVVPAAIVGSYEAWPKGKKMYRRHPVRIAYGPPIDLKGLKPDQIMAAMDQAIRTLFDRLRSGQMTDRLAEAPLKLKLPEAAASGPLSPPRERVRLRGERSK